MIIAITSCDLWQYDYNLSYLSRTRVSQPRVRYKKNCSKWLLINGVSCRFKMTINTPIFGKIAYYDMIWYDRMLLIDNIINSWLLNLRYNCWIYFAWVWHPVGWYYLSCSVKMSDKEVHTKSSPFLADLPPPPSSSLFSPSPPLTSLPFRSLPSPSLPFSPFPYPSPPPTPYPYHTKRFVILCLHTTLLLNV